jgi:hypothetical protein
MPEPDAHPSFSASVDDRKAANSLFVRARRSSAGGGAVDLGAAP